MARLLVMLRHPEETDTVRETGVEVLAEYPDSMLVSATDDQTRSLTAHSIETVPLEQRRVQITGLSFDFEDAVAAQDEVALRPPPGRTAYYLLKLAGPPAPEWLAELEAASAQIHGSLSGFTLLVGILPEHLDQVRTRPWVEEVTPYRPTMKVSPKLHRETQRDRSADELASVDAEEFTGDRPQMVEVSVFPGESIDELATSIRSADGVVLTTLPTSLVASVHRTAIADLAETDGVQAIVPYSMSQMSNDRAKAVMEIPVDHCFEGNVLTGANQIVGVADSGLDTGDPATIHLDVRGRIAGLTSWPTRKVLAPYTNDPAEHDDGPADLTSGHGTHVTGSALGSGAGAVIAGSEPVPTGAAPEAEVFFQAIAQRVNWKSVAQLAAAGLRPFTLPWPPSPDGLYGIPGDIAELFTQAYLMGARIHTNSWGAPVAGEYSQNARAVDEFMWSHPDMLILFAAGNDGVDRDSDGVIDSDSMGSPGTAKNCLAVGATENNRPAGSEPAPGIDRDWSQSAKYAKLIQAGHLSDDPDGMAAFSSRGPTDDFRVKPDVVAPGTNVLSMLSTVYAGEGEPLWGLLPPDHPLRDAYCWSGGTSMATPLVAGTAALIRQRLIEQCGHHADRSRPSGALIKALLVNGATPIPGQFPGEIPQGPNNVSGFGRVDAARSLAGEGPNRTVFADAPSDAVTTGEMRSYTVRAAECATCITATLAWTDAPSLEGLGGLVNELCLQIETPDGVVVSAADPSAVRDNVQQIRIPEPADGVYTVRVRAVSVTRHSPGAAPTGALRQDFALAIAGASAESGVESTLRSII